jgi:hypothetical protein
MSQNTSSILQNRSEFIEQFQREHNYSSNRSFSGIGIDVNSNPLKERWNYLHDLNKLKLAKLEEQRKIQKLKDEENLYSECTFSPKLNKSYNYGHYSVNTSNMPNNNNNPDQTNNANNNSINYTDYLTRQNLFMERKKKNIEDIKKAQNDKNMEQCFFTPEINKDNALNKSHITSKAINLLEDPESYNQYIKRLQKKRDDILKQKQIEDSKPGSGLIWTPTVKKYDLNYDYTKHSISSKNLPRSNSKKSFKKKEKLKNYNNIDRDQYYEGIYKQNHKKVNLNSMNTYTLNNNNNNEDNLLFNQPIEFGKALEILHNELYSFNLDTDENEY